VTQIAHLERIRELAAEIGAAEVATEAAALIERTAGGRFYVACVGQFKRGKSTLINALLGAPVLPTGIVPVTAVPTVVRHGDPGARMRQPDGWHSIPPGTLAEYVSQDANPGNAKQVAGVEVFVPGDLLRGGLCLVDTPGLGSVFEMNTASTVDFLPHIDAAIVVLGADPPITGEELRFVADLGRQVDAVLFVLNKSDRLPADQREEAVGFTRRVVAQALGRSPDPIYQVSAIAPDRGPAVAHGWAAMVAALGHLSEQSGRRLTTAAARRGRNRLTRRLFAILEEERRALVAPLTESDRRIAELGALSTDADRARRELAPVLEMEERDLAREFAQRRSRFLDQVLGPAHAELQARFDHHRSRQTALDLANQIARSRVGTWLEDAERDAKHAYTGAMARFGTLASECLDRVASTAGLVPAAVRLDDAPWSSLRSARAMRFTDLLAEHVSPLPWAGALDALTPPFLARRLRLAAARSYLDHLLTVNATRVESDLRDRIHDSRARLQQELERVLREAGESAQRACERGRVARAAGEASSREALRHLDERLAELQAWSRSGADPAGAG
jgi:GTP-binding protein EngB required for normal cell division